MRRAFGLVKCDCGNKSFHIKVGRSPSNPLIQSTEYYCSDCGQQVELPWIDTDSGELKIPDTIEVRTRRD